MIRGLIVDTIPPRRVEQLRAVRDHLSRALDSVKEPPAGLPAPASFARTAANAVKSFGRIYAGLATTSERETALRSLMSTVLVEAHYWRPLESAYAAHDLGEDAHPFALGAARFAAGDGHGALDAFRGAARGDHAPFAMLCAARTHSVGFEDEGAARVVLKECAERHPSYMPAVQELASVEYRRGDFAAANAVLDSVRGPLEQLLREAPRAANVPALAAEVAASLESKATRRPKGPGQDEYTEALCDWYWRDMWWHMTTFGRFQHGLGWLRWVYETTIDGVLTTDSAIDTVIDFGVLCSEPEFRLSKRHPDKTFFGIDREQATKRMNEAAYGGSNLRFIAGNADEHLESTVKRGSTMLFHARTATLCYPQYMRDLYRQCAKLGVRTIALFENNALDRRHMRYWGFEDMPADALPYIEKMFIHNYERYLEEAGYRLTKVHRLPYTDLFHTSQDLGCDGHVVVTATLA